MEEPQRRLPVRTLGDLLNETFAIYAKRFWRFIGLVAVVQVPVSLLGLIPSGGMATYVAVGVVSLFASVCVFGAAVFAVGLHYLTGELRIGACYTRVWRRLVSLGVISAILMVFIGVGAVLVGAGIPRAVSLVYGVALVVYAVYTSMAVQGVVVEGYKSLEALKRSFGLVRGSWWRVFGNLLVYSLVALGLMILLFLPFLLASMGAAPDETNAVSAAIRVLGSLVVGVVVPPVIFIAGTLLYYDLRVRKEEYDLTDLSQEMGLAAV